MNIQTRLLNRGTPEATSYTNRTEITVVGFVLSCELKQRAAMSPEEPLGTTPWRAHTG